MEPPTVIPVFHVGPRDQNHGFQVSFAYPDAKLIVYTKTAKEARNAALNVANKYGSPITCSIMGY